MSSKVLRETEAKEARRAERFNNTSKQVLNKMVKYEMAEKKRRSDVIIGKRILEANADANLRNAMQLEDELKGYFTWVRQKIQDPTTPGGQKLAYRKMQTIIECRYKPEWLMLNNPLMNPAGGNKAAYGFCYTRSRVS